jgi:hypothetical protein
MSAFLDYVPAAFPASTSVRLACIASLRKLSGLSVVMLLTEFATELVILPTVLPELLLLVVPVAYVFELLRLKLLDVFTLAVVLQPANMTPNAANNVANTKVFMIRSPQMS